MTADAASALFAIPNAAGPAAAPSKGAIAGFEALLASLFAPNADAAATPQGKTGPMRPTVEETADPADSTLHVLAGFCMQAPPAALLPAPTEPSSADALPASRPAMRSNQAVVQPTAGEVLAANLAAAATGVTPSDASAKLKPATAASPMVAALDRPDAPGSTDLAHSLSAPDPNAAAVFTNTPSRACVRIPEAMPAVVVASTFETPAPSSTPGAVVAETPAAQVAAAEAGPIFGVKSPAPALKPEARSTSARAHTTSPASPTAKTASTAPGQPITVNSVNTESDEPAVEHPLAAPRAIAAAEAEPQAPQPSAPGQVQSGERAPPSTPDPATPPMRANAETVSRLAAQLATHVAAKSTQFDIALDPAGLGKVDVRLQIAPDGALTASLAFATPHAASELRARAAELQQALQQAGFDVSDGALSFDVAGHGGQGQSKSNAFEAWQDRTARALAVLEEAAPIPPAQHPHRRAGAAGVDIRI